MLNPNRTIPTCDNYVEIYEDYNKILFKHLPHKDYTAKVNKTLLSDNRK